MNWSESDLRKKGFNTDGSRMTKQEKVESKVKQSQFVIPKDGIWLDYNVPSSKNSKRIRWNFKPNGEKDYPYLDHSKLVKEYVSQTKMAYSAMGP